MKKILVVLTILVLVAGFAFADISGKVSAEYSFVSFNSLKETNAGVYTLNNNAAVIYTSPVKELAASVTLDKQVGGKTGEVMPYVDLSITAEFTRVYENDDSYGNLKNKPADKFELKVATFKIVGEDWSVNLLKAEDAKLDLAKSAIDSVTFYEYLKDENTQSFSMLKDISYAKGLSVTYKDFVVGLGFNTLDIKDDYAAITVEAKTPEFAFGDVKVQAGVGFSQTGNTYKAATSDKYISIGNIYYNAGTAAAPNYQPIANEVNRQEYFQKVAGTAASGNIGGVKAFVGSAKVAYDAEAAKASVAADFSKASNKNEAKFDLAVNVDVAPVTVDVYFANWTQAKNSKAPTDNPQVVEATNLLSAKVVFDVAKLAETVPVKVTVTGRDLLNRYDNEDYYEWTTNGLGKVIDVEANTTALKNFDITATAGDILNKEFTYGKLAAKYTGIEKVEIEASAKYSFFHKTLDFDVTAKYEAEKYTAEGEIEVITDFDESVLLLGASVESDKLVDGATLKAEYETLIGYNLVNSEKASSLGIFTLSCTVEF